jgi:hypothetical protein
MDWRGRSVARGYKSEERGNGAGVKVREFKKVRAVFLKGRIFSKNQNCPVPSVPNSEFPIRQWKGRCER